MELTEIVDTAESIIFAAAEPLTMKELRKIFNRIWVSEEPTRRETLLSQLPTAVAKLRERWDGQAHDGRGFQLMEIAGGLTFRSHPKHAHAIRAMREQRPVRLSRAALEVLSVIAYRQPVTKADVDHIRGVDCGGTLRLLLDRNLIRIVGKREEPGRPLLYGTTREFLSFFNLGNLAQLPSLQEFQELNQDSIEELADFDGVSVEELSAQARQLRSDDEPAVEALDEAVAHLSMAELTTQEAFTAEGVVLEDAQRAQETPVTSSRD